jgi:hypothetical protein
MFSSFRGGRRETHVPVQCHIVGITRRDQNGERVFQVEWSDVEVIYVPCEAFRGYISALCQVSSHKLADGLFWKSCRMNIIAIP